MRLGWPLPTGPPWPAWPQTPTPGSKAKSSPTIWIWVRAVAQLRVLAEPDGVLDGLEAQGYEIEGPAWKADRVFAGSSGLSSSQ